MKIINQKDMQFKEVYYIKYENLNKLSKLKVIENLYENDNSDFSDLDLTEISEKLIHDNIVVEVTDIDLKVYNFADILDEDDYIDKLIPNFKSVQLDDLITTALEFIVKQNGTEQITQEFIEKYLDV